MLMGNICVDCGKEINKIFTRCKECYKKNNFNFSISGGSSDILERYHKSRDYVKKQVNNLLQSLRAETFNFGIFKEKLTFNGSEEIIFNEKVQKFVEFENKLIESRHNIFGDDLSDEQNTKINIKDFLQEQNN